MRSRWTRRALLPLLVVAGTSCSDSGTGSNLTDMALDFCSGVDTPVFIALQNEGQSWTRLTPDANGTISFRASNKVGLTFIYAAQGVVFTDVLYATKAELQPLADAACPELFGTKTLNGSVASVSGTATAEVTMAGGQASVAPPPSTFTLSELPTGPIDLLASRNDFVLGVYAPNRVIARRNVNLTSGATIPALDFAATEAVVPAQSTLSIAGFSASDNTSVFEDFSTVTTTHQLWSESQIPSNTLTIYGFPSSLTQSGDLHILTVRALSGSGNSYRIAELYYRDPANKSAVLGAALNAPVVSTLASSPYLRLSASLPSQAEYGSFASVRHEQGARTVSVTATSGYFGGTPGTWVLDIPDLSGVSGFSVSNYPLQSIPTSYVEAYSGTLSEFFGAFDEGGNLKLAGRVAGAGLAQASIVGDRPRARRSRLTGRGVTFGPR